ncbi:hotdog fold thioesterase [Cesiribacter andamanensis]|uniref:Esterase YdiI n=1 Tax=Cesiribacter andamanensis AMV16 TaxID=1279009 RepID=M7NMC4_9BACT|nr:hotdog fold thioesterase [Cesiribacter andamanensis]EMR02935.1 Esterase YdiI [Cesiribacter andamanensis AMV16]
MKTPIFTTQPTVEALNRMSRNTMMEHLGIEYTEVGADFISARMPVDARTHQPFGLLHGGASVVLAETLGSVAANHCLDGQKQYAVGLDINANHIRSMRSGWVLGTTRPLHIGGKTQVWEIRITSEEGALVCISRITMAVLDKS